MQYGLNYAEQGFSKPSDEQVVESEDTIRKRFRVAKEKYGEIMTFTGPDCGLGELVQSRRRGVAAQTNGKSSKNR